MPDNFNEDYSRTVTVKNELSRSLNIPVLIIFGLAEFRDQLELSKLVGLNKSSDQYGITLILQEGESNLWNLCKTYANMPFTLNPFHATSSDYFAG